MRSNTSAKCVSQSAAFLFLLLSLFVPVVSFAQDNDLSEMGLLRKQQAINKLGNRLAAVAAKHGKSPSELRRMFLQDSTLHIDKNDRLLYVEAEPNAAEVALADAHDAPQVAPFPYSDTFALHSRPSSARKIYLDFNGHTISPANAWKSYFSSGVATPFNLDNDPNSFSAAEQDVIQNIWLRISEDYAAFDVDVTTEDPGGTVYGTRAVMTPTNFMGAGIGGVAFMGAFGGPEDFQPAWVFTGGWGGSDKGIAEAASHEIGHNFGLDHDGNSLCVPNSGCNAGYYSGHGVWAPIMGVGYSKSVTHWSKGEYPGATTQEDDLVIMQRYAPLIADDYGNTTSAARVLSGTNLNISGLITTRDDVDVFRFTTGSGNVSININSAPRGANLDIKAQILDSAGNVIATSDPSCFSLAATFPAGMAASFNQFLSAGTYYLTIDGVGNASDDSSAGYSDYASLGQYNIIGTLGSGGGSQPQPPVAVVSASSRSGTAPLNVSFFSTGSNDPDGSIVSYAWNFGDGTGSSAQNPSKIYYSAGTFTASLIVTDNSGLTGTGSVLITVTNPAVASIAGTLTYGNTPAGQSTKYVSNVLLSANGAFFASTNANGSYLLDNLTAGGSYTVTPSKTGNINGITAYDATLVLRHVASGGFGTNALNANQQLAADTNNSGDVTSFDATQILRYVAANGTTANTGHVGNWRFSPAPRSYNSVFSPITNQNYEAVIVGEINGNWSPTGSEIISGNEKERQKIAEWQKQETRESLITENAVFKSEQSAKTEFNVNAEAAQHQAQISLPTNATGQSGTIVSIPITLNSTSAPIVAYTIEVSYDPNVLQAAEFPISTANTLSDPNTGAVCQVFSGTFNTGNRTTLRMAAACSRNITASGTLLFLRFNVVGTANTATGTTTLEFTVRSGANAVPNLESDGGTMPVTITNGSFTVVSSAPIASVTIAGRVLTPDNRGLRNAQIRLTAADGTSKTVMSGAFGNYRFANVQAGQSVTIQVFSKRFGFQPQTVNVSGDISGLNFVAQP
ncbi:MAG TPA: PKD domain-containing protein [Pyrinomonadaceae bacterium]